MSNMLTKSSGSKGDLLPALPQYAKAATVSSHKNLTRVSGASLQCLHCCQKFILGFLTEYDNVSRLFRDSTKPWKLLVSFVLGFPTYTSNASTVNWELTNGSDYCKQKLLQLEKTITKPCFYIKALFNSCSLDCAEMSYRRSSIYKTAPFPNNY